MMSNYGFLIGPYFLGFAIVAVSLGLTAIWSGRSTWVRVCAVLLSMLSVYLSFVVVEDLLSRPKPTTFVELQLQIPEGHPGHLVLYGEASEEGIYLLLRSPAHTEPRYVLLTSKDKNDAEEMKENFEKAQRQAKRKGTQLLLGGKTRGRKSDSRGEKVKGEEDTGAEQMFHPAPVSGGPEKDTTTFDRPISIPTPP